MKLEKKIDFFWGKKAIFSEGVTELLWTKQLQVGDFAVCPLACNDGYVAKQA